MIISEPLRDKHRVIRGLIALGKMRVHFRGAFAEVVIVDSLDTTQAVVPGFCRKHVLIRKRKACVPKPGMSSQHKGYLVRERMCERIPATAQGIRGLV